MPHTDGPPPLNRGLLVFFIIIQISLFLNPTFSVDPRFPRITKLSASDPVFLQYSDDVATARIALANPKRSKPLPFALYVYTAGTDDSILSIAARCAIPYDAIASLNRLSSVKTVLNGKTLLLPTLPGLYIHDTGETALETLLISSVQSNNLDFFPFNLKKDTDKIETIRCIPGALFEGTVRSFFLTPEFLFPLPNSRITSSFGMRKNPITGNLIFHRGIDLAAPRGTPVRSCATGTVKTCGYDQIYGNYIIIAHDGKRESLYGHLEKITIELHEQIKSGTIIGTVGSTGQSTGPHLHFEIHENGVPKDPTGLLKGY